MTMLRDLLATWETWSAHNVMTHTLGHAPAGGTAAAALDALRDSAELVELLSGWQWQAMHAALRDGATWDEIAAVLKVHADRARGAYTEVLDRQDRILGRDVSAYREVL